MDIKIRDFRAEDIDALVSILKANQQYGHPEMDGPEAMLKVSECEAAEFLVAEQDGRVAGMIRGTFDGSRAVIYIASVDRARQRHGIGRALVLEIGRRFQARGARSISVIVPGEIEFWKRMSFRETTRVMHAYPIEQVVETAARRT